MTGFKEVEEYMLSVRHCVYPTRVRPGRVLKSSKVGIGRIVRHGNSLRTSPWSRKSHRAL